MTQIIHTLQEWQALRRNFKKNSIGFVPTMGNLHKGHESLLARAKAENQTTVLSIFINPAQFDDPNDLKNYPQTLQEDLKIAEKLGIDWVLIPKYEDLYADKYHYRVTETQFSHTLCGKYRPGHFEGVLTVVLKLLLLVKPTSAYFGEKDFQQLELIKGMVQAFFLEVNIVPCQTIRDANGLALSSRNQRLSPREYQLALEFPRLLHSTLTHQQIANQLIQLGFVVEYIEEYQSRRLGAVRLGNIRLIDNVNTHTY
jgi:pantoate--beta-alanine ligase